MAQLANRIADVISDKSQGTTVGKADGPVAANAGGDYVPLNGYATLVRIKNGGGSPITATVDSVASSSFGTDVDVTVNSIAAGATSEFVIKNGSRFDAGGANKGYAKVTCSGVTSVTIDAVVIP